MSYISNPNHDYYSITKELLKNEYNLEQHFNSDWKFGKYNFTQKFGSDTFVTFNIVSDSKYKCIRAQIREARNSYEILTIYIGKGNEGNTGPVCMTDISEKIL